MCCSGMASWVACGWSSTQRSSAVFCVDAFLYGCICTLAPPLWDENWDTAQGQSVLTAANGEFTAATEEATVANEAFSPDSEDVETLTHCLVTGEALRPCKDESWEVVDSWPVKQEEQEDMHWSTSAAWSESQPSSSAAWENQPSTSASSCREHQSSYSVAWENQPSTSASSWEHPPSTSASSWENQPWCDSQPSSSASSWWDSQH